MYLYSPICVQGSVCHFWHFIMILMGFFVFQFCKIPLLDERCINSCNWMRDSWTRGVKSSCNSINSNESKLSSWDICVVEPCINFHLLSSLQWVRNLALNVQYLEWYCARALYKLMYACFSMLDRRTLKARSFCLSTTSKPTSVKQFIYKWWYLMEP